MLRCVLLVTSKLMSNYDILFYHAYLMGCVAELSESVLFANNPSAMERSSTPSFVMSVAS